ncbi:MAG: PLP-dependent aspartate aminotransferase family protein [Fimbriimonadaceae bacterium]
MRFSTKAIRVGQDPDSDFRAVINPIYQSATFAWEDLHTIPKHDYTRCANPNRTALETVLADLEGGKYCVCYSSGMGAIIAALSLVQAGDHVLIASDIYGGTYRVYERLFPRQGIQGSEFDATNPASMEEQVRPNTKMVIFETPTNPNLRVMDIEALASKARELGLISVFDNTFASPYLQRPLELGCDIVVHSTTKYIGGHSDIIGGALITNREDWRNEVFEFLKTVGSAPSPFDCWLALRGVKTLALRMEKHCQNAQAVAEFLENDPRVAKVHYPGLPSSPGHEIAKKQMSGFGGMVSFEVKGTPEQAQILAEATRIFMLAESLGGVESIIGYPPLMSHATMTEEQRLAKGIPPTMLRLSVGIEDTEDLIEDLDQALLVAFAGSDSPSFAMAK